MKDPVLRAPTPPESPDYGPKPGPFQAFTLLTDAVIATDRQGLIVFINPAAAMLTGWPEPQALGQPYDKIIRLIPEFTGDAVTDSRHPVARVLHHGAPLGPDARHILLSRDGNSTPIEYQAVLIPSQAGETDGVVFICRDITARKVDEKVLRSTIGELEKQVQELQRANNGLKDFAHVASHDLKTPVNALIQLTDILDLQYRDRLDEKGNQIIHYIADSAQQMRMLVDDVLNYASITVISSGNASGETELETALKNLHDHIVSSGAVISYDTLPEVHLAPAYIVQVFQHLISNALNYHGAEKPVIHVSAMRQDDNWLFSVRDNGIGIDAQYHGVIFEPFQRLHGSDFPAQGSGMGLAICRKIIEQAGGKIWLESSPGAGSTFYFSLPSKAD